MIKLTLRQYEVAQLIVAGRDVEEIAYELRVSVWNIKRHVRKIRAKCGANAMRDIPDALARHGYGV